MEGTGGFTESSNSVFVVPDEVSAFGRNVYDIANVLHSALDSAAKDVDELLSQRWSGAAADEFADGWREAQDAGLRIARTLTDMAAQLGVSADNYRSNDSGSASKFTEL
ncbi:WXG100 family type VII secretion target [Nocardia sp. NPDC060256]|uniref:WXG100 family type VII secretion target n=1 Tax=unclassified Nocardia TaxID=2637762 RepID=UPI00365A9F43